MKQRTALMKAIKEAGSQQALADAIGVRQSHISYWLRIAPKGVPAEWVAAIEKVGKVPRYELRPDLFPKPDKAERAA